MENNNQIQSLKEAIVRAIVFFDLFDYPLSPYEIWQYLDQGASLLDVKNILNNGLDGVESQDGFYFLNSRSETILERQKRYHFSAEKFRLARRAAKLFKLVPFVEMIAVSNIIGSHNLRNGSDIDLFVVASPRRLWLTRLFCAGLAKILGWRPTKDVKRNRICLSFYASSAALNLEGLKLSSEDLYFNYWLAGLVPVYDCNQTYVRLIKENNWLKESLPNWQELKVNSNFKIKKQLRHFRVFSGFLNILEKNSMAWQLKIMPLGLKSLINIDTRVRVDDKIIKLYLVDRRREFLDKFSSRLDQILNK
ncbi:MAG: hypothetical protein WCJ57_03950 [Candidatus Falkowbacteria bacterium]